MGFRIWAHGLRGFKKKSGKARKAFHYSKDNCLELGDFDAIKIISMIPTSPTAKGVAVKLGKKAAGGGGLISAMAKLANMEFAHLLVQQVNLLAMHGRGGMISLYCHEKNLLWADSNSFVKSHFFGANPGRDFLKDIGPGLEKTGLNDFGALAQISMAISEYDRRLPRSAEANLRIELRH